ncbi:hypothetical protein QTN47_20700 [Danxiaibacter flavus]|uniref:Nucleotide-diphospho-sugar transferase domain-containing protein n=1 Tax=Danxiaibacter flavus TaxID=3049108 RepID=A0ABV3ZKB4_9BACT|nr:hypothetical protein QNM32_20705 [Chitinophagaceae bacterium DXS]
MQLSKIITLANRKTRLSFLAMERSLRASGCNLPLWVIPYDDNTFELPENSKWWQIPIVISWTIQNNIWPALRKIQCLTTENYQFVDSDVIFFKNPEQVLRDYTGFVTSCTHWNNPGHTYTTETLRYLRSKTSTWPRMVFNSGQWACDRKLYDSESMIYFCEHFYTDTLFTKTQIYKDQAAINLLVNYCDVPITNLTLPPTNMESTWAGDYQTEEFFSLFEKKDKPYLIHWAGTPVQNQCFINQFIYKNLTAGEQAEFILNEQQKQLQKKTIQKLIHKLTKFAL